MTAPGAVPGGRAGTSVLLAAGGAAWEADALELLSQGGPSVAVTKRCVDLTDLLGTAAAGTAGVALVSPDLPGLDADSLASLRRSGVAVVAVASPEDVAEGDAERMHRIGVEHLLLSTELALLVDTVRRAGAFSSADEITRPGGWTGAVGDGRRAGGEPGPAVTGAAGSLVAVWGPSGAPGRTTVAVGIAGELARAGREVLLVDADAYGGAVAQHLGLLDEVSGLLAAARAANAGQLDTQRLVGVARQVSARMRVLTGLPRPDRWQEVRQPAFEDLLQQARLVVGPAGYVVVDLGFSLEREPGDPFGGGPHRSLMTLTALERADEVLVVGAADPVGLARLARGLVELTEVVTRRRPRVVVNRTRSSLGWSDGEIRGMVEGFLTPLDVHFLPDDRSAADRALMAGHSLAESRESALRTAMREVARAVLGESAAPGTRRGLRRRRAGRAR
jgi:MinD-like ATPase involved in chromosome partitioning or flagellar assembly